MTTASTKSPVLVILPPTHKCPDLERVLKLARKAFDDLALHILDLNLRFAWVSGDELQPDLMEEGFAPSLGPHGLSPAKTTSSRPALPQPHAGAAPVPAAVRPALPAPLAAQSDNATTTAVAVRKLSIKEADPNCFRIFFSDIAPSLSDTEILGMCPPEIEIIGAIFYPARPLGFGRSMVRSVVFAFAKAKHAKEYFDWIKQSAANGSLAGKLMTKSVLTIFLPQRVELEETLSEPNKSLLFGNSLTAPQVAKDAATVSSCAPAAAAVPHGLPQATDRNWRLVAGNFISTLSKQEIINSLVPQGVTLTGATMYPPSRLGKGRPEMVLFIKLAFASKDHAFACYDWIKNQSDEGGVVRKIITPNGKLSLNEPGAPRPTAATLIPATTPAGPTNNSSPPASSVTQQPTPSPTASRPLQIGGAQAKLPSLPLSAQTLPASVPEPQDCHWRIKVGNLRPSALAADVLANIIPSGINLAGAAIHPPRPLGTRRPEPVHYMTLAFDSQSDARVCREWIASRADVGGPMTDLVSPGAKVYVSAAMTPPASISLGSITTGASGPPLACAISPQPASIPGANPSSPFRLTVGNILHHFTQDQLFANLLPPGLSPSRMTLHPSQQLTGHPEKCRYVALEFKSEHELQVAHDWIRSQAVAGGLVAGLLPQKVKPVINIIKPSTSPSVVPVPAPAPRSSHTHSPPSSAHSNSLHASPATITDLPEASPNNYRLHVSNLDPNLELEQIIPALVPRDVRLVGASLFAPRPMGGSRRELVRSLKFAFLTEWDAKRCQQWIKQDSGGGVSEVVLAGAKIIVGNPMDPMMADPPAEADKSAGGAVEEPISPSLLALAQARPLPPSPHAATAVLATSNTQRTSDLASRQPSRSPSVSSNTSSLRTSSMGAPLLHISLIGIDPAKPVSTVFSTILGSLTGPVEPLRMGVRNANGRRGAEFVFDSEATAKQFVLQVWMGIREGKYVEVTAAGEELKIAKGGSGWR